MFKIPWLKPPRPLTEIDQLIIQLQKANFSYYYNVYSSDLSTLKIATYSSNVIQYIKVLDYILDMISKDQLINRYQIPTQIEYRYLRDWFIDDQKTFVDVEKHLNMFIEKSIIMLNVFQEKESLKDKSFNTEKNLMTTQHITNNLITICRSFLQ